jgi:ribosome modulation factor
MSSALDRANDLLGGLVKLAEGSMQERCPYKNRENRCTAAFGCRNQRPDREAAGSLLCVGSDLLDYRPAWQASATPIPVRD